MTVEFDNQQYVVPLDEPPQDRDVSKLWLPFRVQLEAYVAHAGQFVDGELRIGETRRSLERQVWLYSLGRGNPGPERSWTLNSRHRTGLAADLYIVKDGVAVWDSAVWRQLYTDAPPLAFGLTTISRELVHLELSTADIILPRAAELGISQT